MELLFMGEDRKLFENFMECSGELISEKDICFLNPFEELKDLNQKTNINSIFIDADSSDACLKKQIEVLNLEFFKPKIKVILLKDCKNTKGLDIFANLSLDGILFKPLVKNLVIKQISKLLYEGEQVKKSNQEKKLIQLGKVAGGIGHEINNPIAFVKSNISSVNNYFNAMKTIIYMQDEVFKIIDDEQIENENLQSSIMDINNYKRKVKIDLILKDMAKIIEDSNTGLTLIEDISRTLKDFIRGDQREYKSKYYLNEIVNNAILMVGGRAKKTIDLYRELKSEAMCFCNKSQILQVIMNLIINSIHAIENNNKNKKGVITVKTYDEDNLCVCEILDNGPGVSDEIKEKIFDEFFTTKQSGLGTGVGLNICREIIVKKHGGEIFVENQACEGAKFTMKIPIA